MKYILILLITILFPLSMDFAATPSVTPLAATNTPAPTSEKTQQIEDLKDRLATKVAQLRQTQKRAIFGTVKTKTITTLTIETKTKDVKIELVDEVKVVQIIKGKRTTLTVDDLAKNDTVSVFGEYDATLDILKASTIFIHSTIPVMMNGTITEIDKTKFVITMKTKEEKTYLIDFETTTKTNAWAKSTGIVKTGFSKLTVGDRIHVAGTPDAKIDNRCSAIRILDIGNANPDAITPSPTEQTSATPSLTPKTTQKTTLTTPSKSPTPTR